MVAKRDLAGRLAGLERQGAALWPQPCLTMSEAVLAAMTGDPAALQSFQDSKAETVGEWLASDAAASWCVDLLLEFFDLGHVDLWGVDLDGELVRIDHGELEDAELVEDGRRHHFSIADPGLLVKLLEIRLEDARAAGGLLVYRDVRLATPGVLELVRRQQVVAAGGDEGDLFSKPNALLPAKTIHRELGLDPRSDMARRFIADLQAIDLGEGKRRYRAGDVLAKLKGG